MPHLQVKHLDFTRRELTVREGNVDKDRTHLRDMIQIGLIDATWPRRFPKPLGDRLQQLLDDPDG